MSYLIRLIIPILLLAGCQNKAIDYNEKVVQFMNNFISTTKTFSSKVNKDSTISDFGQFVEDSQRMMAYCDSMDKKFMALEDVPGNEQLKTAVRSEIKFIKDYANYIVALGTTPPTKPGYYDVLKDFEQHLTLSEMLDKDLLLAQSNFANAHGIRINKGK
jgi:hypothetical protein